MQQPPLDDTTATKRQRLASKAIEGELPSAEAGDPSFEDTSAAGALVRVTADLDRHTLAFAVNDGSEVDSGVTLPSAVRPYALLCFEGDVLQFVET